MPKLVSTICDALFCRTGHEQCLAPARGSTAAWDTGWKIEHGAQVRLVVAEGEAMLEPSQASVVPRHSLRWAMLRAAPCSPIMTACVQSMERSFTKTVASMQGLFRAHAVSAMFEPGAILEAILQLQQQRHSQHAVGGGACVAHRADGKRAWDCQVSVC